MEPQKGDKYSKILVIRFSSLGDIILTAPLVNTLRKNFPNAEIDYCTKKEFADTARLFTRSDNVIAVEGDFDFAALKLLKRRLKKERYDLIIDAHNNLRTFYLRWFYGSGAKKLVFRKYSFRKFLLVKFKINWMKNLPPITERYISIVRKLLPGKEQFISRPISPTGDDDLKDRLNGILSENGVALQNKFVVVAPASKHYTKTYPAQLYAELIDKIDDKLQVILVGKGNDIIPAEKIIELTKRKICSLVNKLSISELTELISRCSAFVSGDTGPMHIAEAVGTPLIMLAGSSVKEFGFYPQSANAVVLENSSLPCRPCSHIGLSSCPKGHFKCMNEISPDAVIARLNSLSAK